MRLNIIAIALALVSSPAWAQSTPVCEIFTKAEIAGLLGKPPAVTRSIMAPDTDCVWGVAGLTLNVGRTRSDDVEMIKGAVESNLQNAAKGDIVTSEAGIGEAAVSIQPQYGRSLTLVFRSGKTLWSMNLEKVDKKLDVAAALPKLRALAKKAAATP